MIFILIIFQFYFLVKIIFVVVLYVAANIESIRIHDLDPQVPIPWIRILENDADPDPQYCLQICSIILLCSSDLIQINLLEFCTILCCELPTNGFYLTSKYRYLPTGTYQIFYFYNSKSHRIFLYPHRDKKLDPI